MSRPPRKLRGIPRAGTLYVNGQPVERANVPAAIRAIYRSTRTEAATEPAAVTITTAQPGQGDCAWCNQPLEAGETIAHEPATGQAWHMATGCRAKMVRSAAMT